jgi:hypothetical protein
VCSFFVWFIFLLQSAYMPLAPIPHLYNHTSTHAWAFNLKPWSVVCGCVCEKAIAGTWRPAYARKTRQPVVPTCAYVQARLSPPPGKLRASCMLASGVHAAAARIQSPQLGKAGH